MVNSNIIDQGYPLRMALILFGVYESKRRLHANLCGVNHFSSLREKSSFYYVEVKTTMCQVVLSFFFSLVNRCGLEYDVRSISVGGS